MKIAIIQTHAIQHFCPQFASYSKIDGAVVKVFFESSKGVEPYYDADFKKEVAWSGIDVTGFEHQFLKGVPVALALTDFKPDAIIIYGYHEAIQKQAFKWAKKNSIKILYISDSENHQVRSTIKEAIKRVYLKQFFNHVDYCLSVGDSNEDVYRTYGISNSKIIRMFFPINDLFFDKLLGQKEVHCMSIKKQYDVKSDHIVLATIGKLVSWKRQQDIIELLLELENRGIKATAFIIGSGSDEEALKDSSKRLTTNRAIITGFVQPEEMAKYLCATDIYIHPAEVEPHSLAISEAIYCGCPAILSDRCGSYGPTDDVQPGKNGFVYPLGNIEQLANLVKQLASDNSLRKEFSQKSTLLSRHHQTLAHGEALKTAVQLIQNSK